MLVFVTLVVALLGTYAQIYTKQAARMFAQQSGVAQNMMSWNATAISLVNSLVTGTVANIPSTGCMLTDRTGITASAPTGLPDCMYGAQAVFVGKANTYGVNACSKSQTAPCWTDLPPGYQKAAYPFYSIAWSSVSVPTQYYVLTFVPPPVTSGQDLPGLDLLCLPGVVSGGSTTCPGTQRQLAITFSEFSRQLHNDAHASPMYYGAVNSSHILTTPTVTFGNAAVPVALTYPVPTIVPTGSIGIISQVTVCSSC